MKHQIKLALIAAFLAPVFVIGNAVAQQPDRPTQSQATETEVQTQTTVVAQDPAQPRTLTAEEKQKLAERVQQRKAEAKLRLTNTQQKRIQTRCKASQGKIQSVAGRLNGIETSHSKVHANLVDRLTKLESKLADKNVDTTALKGQITELQAKIETFKTDLASYKVLTSDLVNMDCATDPTAFKASLEATRVAVKKVHDDAVAIRTYVKDTIKPTLQQIRAKLAGESPASQEAAKPEANTTPAGEGQ